MGIPTVMPHSEFFPNNLLSRNFVHPGPPHELGVLEIVGIQHLHFLLDPSIIGQGWVSLSDQVEVILWEMGKFGVFCTVHKMTAG